MKSSIISRTVIAGVAGLFLATAAHAQPETTTQAVESAGKDPVQEIRDFIQAKIDAKAIDKSKMNWKTQLPMFPSVTFDPAKKYFWNMKTSKGDIKVELFPKTAPKHVANVVYLTEVGFYDNGVFHRVIPGFMAQGGCPLGAGTGSPGYRFDGEYPAGGPKHDRPGILSTANAGPGTDGSQFFLTFVETAWLDGKHTVFGQVVAGSQTLTELEKFGSQSGRTKEPLLIEKATITIE
jgi:peptidyl-prolyl cis-trans isomerase B (cyclophilin B)